MRPKNKTVPNKKIDLFILLICLALALAFRLPGLTTFLTADEARSWFGRSIIFLYSLSQADFANTAPGGSVPFIENLSLSPAPGVTTMWAGAIGILIEYLRQGTSASLSDFIINMPFDPLNPAILFYLRLPGVLISVMAVGLTFWWSIPLLGRQGAFLTASLFAVDPFHIALSRVLGHDAFATTFMWLSLLASMRIIESANQRISESASQRVSGFSVPRFVFISGGFAGLAFLSKYPSLFMGMFIALTMLIIYLLKKPFKPGEALVNWGRDMFLWSAAAGVVFIIFWPAMWVNPIETVSTIINDALRASGTPHQKGSFFLGQPVPDPGLYFYPLIAWLKTTPIVVVGILLFLWQFFQRKKEKTVNRNYTIPLILAGYIILYTLLVTYGGKKQDRYLLPIFPALTMIAAIGFIQLSNLKPQRLNLKWVLPIIVVIFQVASIWPAYPYYFSYYNPLAGGGEVVADTVQIGWGEGLNEAATYLNGLPDASSIEVVSWYSTTFEPYFDGKAIYKIGGEKISRSAKPGLAADYVLLYINQTQRQLPSAGALQYFRASSAPVYTVTLQGIDYAWIYPSVNMRHVFTKDTRLVGQAELMGYDLTDEAGQAVTTTAPETVLFLSLYWEWQGKAEDEPIQVSLIDADGNTRGWGNHIKTEAPISYAEWQAGMIARDDFALIIFADTPPGTYHLSVWIARPATGETVGVFPITDGVAVVVVE